MMKIEPFALERYFARYEFTARHLLSCSDCESIPMAALLALADDATRDLWDNLRLGYTDSQGHPLLREAIAAIYDDIRPEDVLVTVPEEGIFLLMQALLNPGKAIPTLNRCAEFGAMHVKAGDLRFPHLERF